MHRYDLLADMSRAPVKNRNRPRYDGPSFKVPAIWSPGEDPCSLLGKDDRAMLAIIAAVGRYKRGETIYQEGARAGHTFNIISGVVKSHRSQPNHKEQVMGFLFPHDLFGLAEQGRYVNSASAVTQVMLYKIPTVALEARLRKDPNLDFQVICRLCHELREAQQHAILLSKHRAVAKLGLFLQMLEAHQNAEGHSSREIQVPMARTDIGAYVNISPEAVTRSLQWLVRRGVISVRDRRYIEIIDRPGLDEVISETAATRGKVPPAPTSRISSVLPH
jgi:CRP/FNR family transcriptional regulator